MLSKSNIGFNRDVVEYSEKEQEYYNFLVDRLVLAREAREEPHPEFNDMSYREYYDSNLKACNSYIVPKKNRSDTRVVTGTTEEKGGTLLAAILNYNLEPSFNAYDEFDMEIEGMGRVMEKLVRKSRELEVYDQKKVMIYKELLDQGNVFVEEQWVEEKKIEKKMDEELDFSNLDKIKWVEKEIDGYKGCSVNLLRGDKVYLGNIMENLIDRQPYIFTVDYVPYSEIKAKYGDWSRFKFVDESIGSNAGVVDNGDQSKYRSWLFDDRNNGLVEVIKYQDKWLNELQIILNGIMMLPVGFPLTVISPSGEYSISKGDGFLISKFFAYSKSIAAKTKVDQEVLDEMMKLIVLKTRKSYMPPLANNTGKFLSEKNLMAGEINTQIDPTKLVELGKNNGVTAAEFNAFQFIKELIDQKTVSPAFSGDISNRRQSATEVLEIKKQQMMKLGLVIWGVIALERQLAWLRLNNILKNWTKVQDKRKDPLTEKMVDIYMRVSLDGEIEENRTGKNIIEFSSATNEIAPEQVTMEEQMLSEKYKMPVKKTYLDPAIANVKYNWFVTIVPTEKDSSDFQRVMFKQDIQDAINLFGPQSLNFEYSKKRFATLSHQDPDKFFVQGVQSVPTDQAMKGGDNGGLGAQLNRGLGTSAMPLSVIRGE